MKKIKIFYEDLYFLKMSVTTRVAANFKQTSWIVLYKEINVQERLGLNLWKIHWSVLILWNFEFFDESAVLLEVRQNINLEPNTSS